MIYKNNKFKRIGIDARFYGPTGKGLGRYTKEVVDRVIRDERYEYVIFLHPENFHEFHAENRNNVKKVLVKARWYSLGEQLILPWLIWRERIGLMHFLHFNVPVLTPVKFIVTVHDLILTKFPTQRASTLGPVFYWCKNRIYKVVIWLAVKRAKKIIAVSNFTRDDIVKQFRADKEKITVTYEGVSDDLKKNVDYVLKSSNNDFQNTEKDDRNIILRYNIHRPYLLYVGNAYPHKNLEGLIESFNEISKNHPDLSLVLVGKEDYFYKRVKKFAQKFNKVRIVFPEYIPDNVLTIVYREALAYVFPTFYEGFGLPPLEAMAHDCPVISSNQASLPEVLGKAAIYFDPYKKGEMIRQIERAINGQELRQELIKKGREQIKKYSWQKCAQETLNIYTNYLPAQADQLSP